MQLKHGVQWFLFGIMGIGSALGVFAEESSVSHPILTNNRGWHVVASDFEGIPQKLTGYLASSVELGDRSVRLSQIVAAQQSLSANLEATLLYGGDAVDRGTASRKILKFWIALKDRFPDQVVLLAGNRDLNKLRFLWEVRGLEGDALVEGVRAIVDKTMGAPDAFEFRRSELRDESGNRDAVVSDLAVAQSFVDEVKPGGLMWEYLIRAQLAYRTQKTMVVHGGAPWAGQPWILPEIAGAFVREEVLDPYTGADRLNLWYRQALLQSGEAGWRALSDYARVVTKGEANNPDSVVYNCMQTKEGMIMLPSPTGDAGASKNSNALERLIVFHKPQGPIGSTCTNKQGHELWILDNSRANDVPPVLGAFNDEAPGYWSGSLADGTPVIYRSHLGTQRGADPLLGRYLPDGFLVAARVAPGHPQAGDYVLKRAEANYFINVQLVPAGQMLSRIQESCEQRALVRPDLA